MLKKDLYFTKDGLKELKAELKQLQKEKLPKLIKRVALARSFGDLSENSEYTASREELSFTEGKVEELETIIRKAKVISNTKKSGSNQVKLGCKVTVKVNGKKHTYEVVGEWEADPLQKKISHTSPLGKALLNKKKGDKIEIEAPAGKVNYHIQKIH